MDLVYRVLRRTRPAWFAVFLRDILGIKRRNVSTGRGTFFVDPVSNFGSRLMTAGQYEPHMEGVLDAYLRPGGVFVDTGANEGYFSVLAAKLVGERGRVIAVEPQSAMIGVIRENLRLNQADNTAIVQAAISDRPGDATLHITPSINTGSASLLTRTSYSVPTEKIPMVTLGGILAAQQVEHVTLLKMDIEGYEYEAITGAADVLAAHRIGAIALEFHQRKLPDGGSPAEKIIDTFLPAGYALAPEPENFSVWIVGGDTGRSRELQAWLKARDF